MKREGESEEERKINALRFHERVVCNTMKSRKVEKIALH